MPPAEQDLGPAEKARRASIIQSFTISGLYGYREISLKSDYAATVLIAKNGSGKTTLLAALDAFLRCQFARLVDLEFRSISCELRGLDRELTIEQADVIAFYDVGSDAEFAKFCRTLDTDSVSMLRFLTERLPEIQSDWRLAHEDKIYSAALRRANYRHDGASELFEKYVEWLYGRVKPIGDIYRALRYILRDTEVVYLPTYRRIELSLVDEAKSEGARRRAPKLAVSASGLFSSDIQFGLADISDRLKELNQSIYFESSIGYRRISADIINDLLDGTLGKSGTAAKEIPSKDDLELFFSRLREGRDISPFGEVSIPKIDKIYSGERIPTQDNQFLRYFLGKLGSVINSTRDIELKVEEFISNCNKYLGGNISEEYSSMEMQEDRKILLLNKTNLSVYAESIFSGTPIQLDSMSSGEKQMISLFAKMFLFPKNKIVLIDEPELSLSIEWQRQILVDVLQAPLCTQIIAITHSPFIFDNELEPFARAVNQRSRRTGLSDLFSYGGDRS